MHQVIDPHIHLINLQQGEYGWLKPDNLPHWLGKECLCRDFSETDLTLSGKLALSGFVHIEAGFDNQQPWRELEWLEQHCTLPFRAIACADITASDFASQLKKLKAYSSFVGVRHILDQDAVEILANPQVLENLTLLEQSDLIFEAQFSLRNRSAVSALLKLLLYLPQLKVVINHAGGAISCDPQWVQSVKELAEFDTVSVKCSGWEMQLQQWDVAEVKAVVSYLIGQFSLLRVMLASNFPVSNLSCDYQALWQRYTVEMNFTDFELEHLCFENAKRIYQINR